MTNLISILAKWPIEWENTVLYSETFCGMPPFSSIDCVSSTFVSV